VDTRITHPFVLGQRFGRLVVLEEIRRSRSNGRTRRAWRCQCDCGSLCEPEVNSIISEDTLSCGCLAQERRLAAVTRHGKVGTPENNAFHHMWARCRNPNDNRYHCYGARGISVCARWKAFEAFYADMGPRPSDKHSLDRLDNDGGYWCGKPECPDCGPLGRTPNCRWTTVLEQRQNRRPNPTKAHCSRGHERTPENTYTRPNGRRVCIQCRLICKENRTTPDNQ
jgi:hypothetical protein